MARPIAVAITDATMTPALTSFKISVFANASEPMNRLIVKPIPARQLTTSSCPSDVHNPFIII